MLRYHTSQPLGRLWEAVWALHGGVACARDEPWSLGLIDRGLRPDDDPESLGMAPDAVLNVVPGWRLLSDRLERWRVLSRALGRRDAEQIAPQTYAVGSQDDLSLWVARHQPDWSYLVEAGAGAGALLSAPEVAAVGQARCVWRLVPDPILLSSHRTELRLYVVLQRHAGRLTAWRYRGGEVRYAACRWSEDPLDREALLMGGTPASASVDGPHALDELWPYLQAMGLHPMWVRRRIASALSSSFGAWVEHLSGVAGQQGAHYAQLFAVDVAVTQSGRVRITHVQHAPDMGARTVEDAERKSAVMQAYLGLVGLAPPRWRAAWEPLAQAMTHL